jgi:hypothetical protein
MQVDPNLVPIESIRAVESLAEAFDSRSIRYALIGGLGVILRGRPRFTHDVDFLLEVPQIVLPGLLDELVERGFAIDPAVVIKQFVREHVASFPFGRVRFDWLKPVLPLSTLERSATPRHWNGPRATRFEWRPPRG